MGEPARRRLPSPIDASLTADGARLDDLGRELGVTRERARQIQAEALRHARELLVERLGLGSAADLARDA
jgi:hypothetical protein